MKDLLSSWNNHQALNDLAPELKLYRGFAGHDPRKTIVISSPENRTPRDVPIEIQIMADNYFEEKFGIRFRQRGIFCSGDISVARNYANSEADVRVISALTDFGFCWSPKVKDLYESLPYFDGTEKTFHSFLESANYKTSDLEAAIRSGNEIILVGDEFSARSIKD
ncbi:hypothetical protein [Xanthomonas sacchari]|uniref:hypothetical protein n=1 Tax=Xanthomonas sacchari TaxID=56458 RepID=UPI00225E53A1|nr:hypothetical protein [Xanthomonas sacchari]